MRKFEKISFEQFKKDVKDDIKLYDSYNLPKRGTKYSAGYDFEALFDFTIKPGKNMLIPTGIKADMNEGETLLMIERSSQGFKYNIRMCNQVGVIDKDYYGNPDNDGHIMFAFYNIKDEDTVIKKGECIGQAIFEKFLVADGDAAEGERLGGFGSTSL